MQTVPDALLTLLRWCLLALLYLFFFRVLQATWATTAVAEPKRRTKVKQRRTKAAPVAVGAKPAPAPAGPGVHYDASTLVVLEPDDLAGRAYPLGGPQTIGRAAGCEITLDDTYISQIHARVLPGESGLLVEDLGSTNGTYLNRTRVTVPVVAHAGDRLQVGSIVMEFQ